MQAYVELRDSEDTEANFKPKTNNYPLAGRETSGDKCLDLYARVKPGQNKDNKGRSQVDAAFENEKEECSFKPQINKPGSHLKGASKSALEIKGFDEQRRRLDKGREKEKIKELVHERNPTSAGAFSARRASSKP